MTEYKPFGWYAAKIAPHLPKDVYKPVPSRLLGGLAYLLITVTGIFTVSLFDLPIWLNVLLAVVIGLCFAGMGFLGHEILHGTVVKKAMLRNFFGAICFFPFTTGPLLWRKWHNMTHHVHTQHTHNDPDTWATLDIIENNPILRKILRVPKFIRALGYFLFLSINFNTHSTRMFFEFIREFKPSKRLSVWIQFLLPWATWIGLIFLIGPVDWIFAYLVPALIANVIVSSYIATNHNLNEQTSVNDPLANTLSVTVPKWVDALHFNFSYHTEHHLFPAINPKYYPIVKEEIKKRWPERYHEMPFGKAMMALLKTPRIYFEDKEFIDIQQGKIYGTLGNGLDPHNIDYRSLEEEENTTFRTES
jgi:fatty acid desaturase